MSKRSSKLSVASGPQKTTKSRSKISKHSPMSSSSSSSSAPSAVSFSRMAGVSYSSSTVAGRSSLRVSTVVPICEIGNSGDLYGNGFLVQGTSAAIYSTTCELAPYEIPSAATNELTTPGFAPANWISPHLPLLALAFDRYKVDSLEFSYEPQATTTISDRLVFAWTDDPAHPILSTNGIGDSGATPTQLQALITQDSVAFMPWKQWKLRVPVSKDVRFMYSDIANEGSAGTPLDRFNSFGCMTCVGNGLSGGATVYGVLYVKIILDLLDPVPIVSNINVLLTTLHETRRLHRKASRERLKVKLTNNETKEPIIQVEEPEPLPPNPPLLTRQSAYVNHSTSLPPSSSSSSTSQVRSLFK